MLLQIVSLTVAAAVGLTLLWVLRTGRLREKYVALWIIIGVGIIALSVWPGLLDWASLHLGIQVPSNLLFFLAILLLVGVTLHLSLEASSLEDETRKLAEEVAIINATLHEHGMYPTPEDSDEGTSTAP